jgi:hypothetical protein
MPDPMTRRTFLGTAAAIGAATCLPALAAPPSRRLIVGRRIIEVLGKPAEVYGVTDGNGRSGLVLDPAERFSVAMQNALDEATTVHWHGMTPTPELDGIAETGYVAPLAAGEIRSFDFAPRPGTHWMHSHHGLQEQALLTAPLIVREADGLDAQEVTLLLNDFSFRDPAEIFAGLTGQGGMAGMDHGNMGGGAAPMDHSAMADMDLNDVEYDAFLANDRTLDDPEVIRTERNGRVRLRIINGASATAFWIDLGAREATVLAVDGNPVQPVTASRFPLAQAQRLDLLLEVPACTVVPVFARREGDRARTGIILAAPGADIEKYAGAAEFAESPVDLSLEQRLVAAAPLELTANRPATDGHAGWSDGALCLDAQRQDLAAAPEARGALGPARRPRVHEPLDDGPSDAPAWPSFPGDRDQRHPHRGSHARHRAGAADGLSDGRVRRR